MLPPDQNSDSALPRVLGPFDATALVVGGIIGSGVFLKASLIAATVGSFGPIISVWVVLGLVTLCGSLTLAELATMLPKAGGPYVYLREAYGRLPAFLWGWTEFWVIRTGSLGALACATVIYLNAGIRNVYVLSHWEQGVIAIVLILFLTFVNWRSTRWGATLQNVTTVIKVGFLAALIVLPFVLGKTDSRNLGPIWPEEITLSFWRAIGIAAIAVLWPYDGWVNLSQVAEEVRNPQRNIPLALSLGIFIIIVIYVLANAAYHLVLPMGEVASSDAVASEVFFKILGNRGAQLAALGVMCSTLGATQSNLLTGPRIYFAMARDGLLPSRLAEVHDQNETPGNAIVAQSVWASLLVVAAYAWQADPSAAFNTLTDFVIFGGSVFYAMAVAAVFVLRWRQPDLPRPYRTWGYPLTPIIYLAAFGGAMASMLTENWKRCAAGGLLILAGAVYYLWAVRRADRKPAPAADPASV
jgi:APA family basic amino acid/polyamine antiporter